MITIVSNDGTINYGIKHYVADNFEDLNSLNTKGIQMGSTAFIIDTSEYYMLNGEKTWKLVELYKVNGNGSSTVLPSQIIYDGGGA